MAVSNEFFGQLVQPVNGAARLAREIHVERRKACEHRFDDRILHFPSPGAEVEVRKR